MEEYVETDDEKIRVKDDEEALAEKEKQRRSEEAEVKKALEARNGLKEPDIDVDNDMEEHVETDDEKIGVKDDEETLIEKEKQRRFEEAEGIMKQFLFSSLME